MVLSELNEAFSGLNDIVHSKLKTRKVHKKFSIFRNEKLPRNGLMLTIIVFDAVWPVMCRCYVKPKQTNLQM
jgi:hypothetical protein